MKKIYSTIAVSSLFLMVSCAKSSTFSSEFANMNTFFQSNCNLEVQFNVNDNKLTSPAQFANLNQILSTSCTWNNYLPNSTIARDAGMQMTIWVQNDPLRPAEYAKENKLERLHLHCVFTPTTQGLGGKRRTRRSRDGIDYITEVQASKSGERRPILFYRNIKNGNESTDAYEYRIALVPSSIKTEEHSFNQIIDADVPNYATFWDTQADPTFTTHPSYSQINITFLLNGESHNINEQNYWFGKKIFNDGDVIACDITLPDHR